MTDRVVNLKNFPRVGRNQYLLPADVVRVDRGSPWGNPHVLAKHERPGDRAAVIAAFARYAVAKLRQEPDWLEPLAGKRLACHCAPKRCHAEVLAELEAAGLTPETMGSMGKLVFGVDRLPAKEAETAPAWPSGDALDAATQREYEDFIRGRR